MDIKFDDTSVIQYPQRRAIRPSFRALMQTVFVKMLGMKKAWNEIFTVAIMIITKLV